MNGQSARWNVRLPINPGFDFSGIISVLPEGDTLGFEVGDEVFGVNWGSGHHDDPDLPLAGTFSEYCLVPLNRLSRKPAGLSFDEAAALPMAGCTAYQCLYECGQVAEGQRVLILGGDTAVGSIAIGLAKKAGAW